MRVSADSRANLVQTIPQKNQPKVMPNIVQKRPIDQHDQEPKKNISDTPDIKTDIEDTKTTANQSKSNPEFGKKAKLFAGNFAFSTIISSILAYNSRNDPSGQRFGLQDIVTNLGIMGEIVKKPTATANQLVETIKETTLFVSPTSVLLPLVANYFKQDFGLGTFAAALTPVVVSEAIGRAADKPEKLSKEELEKQKSEVVKTHCAVGLAAALKSVLLWNNIHSSSGADKNNYVSNAMYLATLLNTLRSSLTTQLAHNRGERVRDASTASPVFFDGVVSGLMVQLMEHLSKNHMHKIHDTLGTKPNDMKSIAWQSVVGGIGSIGGIYVVKETVDNALNWILGTKANKKSASETPQAPASQDKETIKDAKLNMESLTKTDTGTDTGTEKDSS